MAAAVPACDPLAALPLSVAFNILARLPLSLRLRCAEVCRGWRAVLSEPSFWANLDLADEPGGAASEALFLAAAARARGSLRTLRVACNISHAPLLSVFAANAALHEAHLALSMTETEVDELARAAPRLRILHVSFAEAGVATARRMMRRLPPFAALRVRNLCVAIPEEDERTHHEEITTLAADVASHETLTAWRLMRVPLDGPAEVLEAVVAAALARQLRTLELIECATSPASVPALVRLLRDGPALTSLAVACFAEEAARAPLLDAPSAAALAATLRINTTLTALTLRGVGVWSVLPAAHALLEAATSHPSLQKLDLSDLDCTAGGDDSSAAAAAAFAALGALVAANAPALQELRVNGCNLSEPGMHALLAALPGNTHLRLLDCADNNTEADFADDVLLPAVQANTSLRRLQADALHPCDDWEGIFERRPCTRAMALVAARAQQQL
jgi:hypothetical protein